jgi:hypothetical protein
MGSYCKFCDFRCFRVRVLTDGTSLALATCPAGMEWDRRHTATGQDHTTAHNPAAGTTPCQPACATCIPATEPAPAVDVDERPENTDFAWVWEGVIARGTIDAFADFLAGAQAAGHDYPKTLYAPTVAGELTPLPYHVKSSGYDDNDYATATVAVTLAEGVTVTGTWTVDGRS